MSEGKEEEINLFLKEFKKVVKQRGIDFIPRQEFIETLILFGITRWNCEEEILSLSVDGYCQGPDDDRDRPGKVWVFGRHIEGREVYIKLKLATVGKEAIAKCLSFHPAEFPLCFPLRSKKGGKEQ